MRSLLAIYGLENRTNLLRLAGSLVVAVALVDWLASSYISLGFLYLVPIMMVSGFLTRPQIIGAAVACAVLQEVFSNLPPHESVVRLIVSSGSFAVTGLFVSELVRNRRIVSEHLEELESQIRLRRDAEEQLKGLIESSPAAILTIDENANIRLANEAAQDLLSPGQAPLHGQPIGTYLPSLEAVVRARPSRTFRTTLQCTARRSDGGPFLAGVWFSTYATVSSARVAAIVVDLSEELRSRESLGVDHLSKHARILMSGVAHEVRNLCGAMLVVHKNLSRLGPLEANEDFLALGTLIQGLERLAGLELRPSAADNGAAVDVRAVLDELRVLVDVSLQESQIETRWQIPAALPLVRADRYGLVQVFLNLARNSQQAMEDTAVKELRVTASREGENVVIRFEDTGVGIKSPEFLFRPFQSGAGSIGLGLYVSRAILRSCGGDLAYEARDRGCCFAVMLHSLPQAGDPPDA